MRPNYHIDLIRINSKKTIEELSNILNLPVLEDQCKWVKIQKPFSIASYWGYKSRLEAILPTPEFFNLLVKSDSAFELPLLHISKEYSVSYIEIAKDTFFNSRLEAHSNGS